MLIKIDHEKFKKLTNTEKQVINYINVNGEALSNMSIVDLAEETFTSPATVSRAIKKCGLGGFVELRYLISQKNESVKNISDVNEVLKKSMREATRTVESISVPDILQSVDFIRKSDRILVFSRGLTDLVAEEFALKLQLLGYNVFQVTDPNIMRNLTKEMKTDHLLIVFSLQGQTEELVESVEHAISLGCKVITCCCGEQTSLMNLSTVYLKGFATKKPTIQKYEVTSRLPLHIISRILIDYLAL